MKALIVNLLLSLLLEQILSQQYGSNAGGGGGYDGKKKGGGCPGGQPGPSAGGTQKKPDTMNPPQPQQPPPSGQASSCTDASEYCCFWASLGHCDSNLYWMRPNCQKACGTCGCTIATALQCQVKLGSCGASPGAGAPGATASDAPPAETQPPAPAETAAPEPPPPAETPAPAPMPEPATQAPAQPPQPSSGECADKNELCCFWASLGHCDSNPLWMRPNCQKACGTCGCTQESALSCQVKLGECSSPGAPGEAPQTTAPSETEAPATEPPETEPPAPPVTEAPAPPEPETQPPAEPAGPAPSGDCEDKNEMCCFWAGLGHCDSNPFWMRPNCQKACGTCGCTVQTATSCTVSLGACAKAPGGAPAPAEGGGTPAPQESEAPPPPETEPPAPPPTEAPAPPPAPAPAPAPGGDNSLTPPSGGYGGSIGGGPTGIGGSGVGGQQTSIDCTDKNDLCCFWASLGHCDSNPLWMRPNCQKACGTCGCTFESALTCPVKLGACGTPGAPGAPGGGSQSATPAPEPAQPPDTEAPQPPPETEAPPPLPTEPPMLPPAPEAQPPPATVSPAPPAPQPGDCQDSNQLCCFWASLGHCDSNLFWMRPNCQKACGTCGCTVEAAPTCKVNLGSCSNMPGPPAPAAGGSEATEHPPQTSGGQGTGSVGQDHVMPPQVPPGQIPQVSYGSINAGVGGQTGQAVAGGMNYQSIVGSGYKNQYGTGNQQGNYGSQSGGLPPPQQQQYQSIYGKKLMKFRYS